MNIPRAIYFKMGVDKRLYNVFMTLRKLEMIPGLLTRWNNAELLLSSGVESQL